MLQAVRMRLKILISFAQVITSFQSAFRLNYPVEVEQFLDRGELLFRPGSLVTMDFISRTQLVCIVPLRG